MNNRLMFFAVALLSLTLSGCRLHRNAQADTSAVMTEHMTGRNSVRSIDERKTVDRLLAGADAMTVTIEADSITPAGAVHRPRAKVSVAAPKIEAESATGAGSAIEIDTEEEAERHTEERTRNQTVARTSALTGWDILGLIIAGVGLLLCVRLVLRELRKELLSVLCICGG